MPFMSSGYSVNCILSPTLVSRSRSGEATLSAMVIDGQPSAAIGSWRRVIVSLVVSMDLILLQEQLIGLHIQRRIVQGHARGW